LVTDLPNFSNTYQNTLQWLLEPSNPSVRFFTLTELIHLDKNASEVKEAKKEIMLSDPVRRILSKQTKNGSWGKAEDF
jgi:hypothetical protein